MIDHDDREAISRDDRYVHHDEPMETLTLIMVWTERFFGKIR